MAVEAGAGLAEAAQAAGEGGGDETERPQFKARARGGAAALLLRCRQPGSDLSGLQVQQSPRCAKT